MSDHGHERQPLLEGATLVSPSSSSSLASSLSISKRPSTSTLHLENGSRDHTQPSRAIEDDVLPEDSTLGRTITWQSAYIIVISRVIGSGIFATPGAILQSVGSPGLSLLLWVAGTVVAACGLAVSLEFGSMLPRSGGDKVYLEFTYRHPRFLASILIAVHAVLLGFTASNCIVFSQYVLFALGQHDASDALRKGIGAGILATIVLIHTVLPKTGVRIQNVLGWVKIGVVLFMILSGIYVILFRETQEALRGSQELVSNQLSWDVLWKDSNWNWGVMSTSLFKVFYSFAGLDNISNVLNEVKNPVRTLRSVTSTALITAGAMYLLINVAYFLVVPLEEIKHSGELVAALFFERVFGNNFGRVALPLAVALSAAGNVMVVAFAMARLKQEIARQGFLPFSDFLSSTKPFGSPLGGLLLHFVPSFLVIVLPPSQTVYSFILEVEGYPGQMVALALGLGLIWLRVKRPDLKRPFKAWLPAVLVRVALSISLLAGPFFPPAKRPDHGIFYATYAIVGVSMLLAGVVYWYLWARLIPRWWGYTLEEEAEVLSDGTSVTKLVHKPRNVDE